SSGFPPRVQARSVDGITRRRNQRWWVPRRIVARWLPLSLPRTVRGEAISLLQPTVSASNRHPSATIELIAIEKGDHAIGVEVQILIVTGIGDAFPRSVANGVHHGHVGIVDRSIAVEIAEQAVQF